MGSYNMGFKEFVALTIGLLHISLSNCQEFEVAEKQCVPYSSCSEISWLYQNGALQNEIDPNELTCGYENEPLVWCHIDDMAIDNSDRSAMQLLLHKVQYRWHASHQCHS